MMRKHIMYRANPCSAPKSGSFFTSKDRTRSLFFQPKLSIGPIDDPYEQEADAVADQIMHMPAQGQFQSEISPLTVQRKCSKCEEEEKQVQRKESGESTVNVETPEIIEHALQSGGTPLDVATKGFMESRFGYDFSQVKVHTGTIAAKSAQAVNALAYTSGNSIVFSKGQYAPGTESGKRLLAHELTHVVQQNTSIKRKVLQRCPDPASTAEFDTKAAQVRAHAAYGALSSANRTVTEEIIRLSRDRDDCIYFIDRLLVLFNTPLDQSPAVGAAASATMASAAEQERERLATPEGRRLMDIEERTAADSSRSWETLNPPARTWGHMATFRIDRSDPANMVVQARIRVTGDPADVANIVAQEDGIEKAAQELGYTLDVIFVNSSGPNVFTVSVNPAAPVTAGNWSAYDTDPSAYTHEIHHLLGLEDRYDYTSHAYNTRMPVADRLHWFRIEAGRPADPLGEQSLMGSGSHLLDDDICRVSQLDFTSCMASRQARRDMITRARGSAFVKSFRVFQLLSMIRPPSPHGEEQYQLEQRRALLMARAIFGEQIATDQLVDIIGSMRHRLTPGIPVRFAQSLDTNCTGNAYYVVNMIPPLALCPEFFGLSTEDRTKSFLRAAAQMVRVDNSLPVSVCSNYDCGIQCGDFNKADAWAKFVWCASGI